MSDKKKFIGWKSISAFLGRRGENHGEYILSNNVPRDRLNVTFYLERLQQRFHTLLNEYLDTHSFVSVKPEVLKTNLLELDIHVQEKMFEGICKVVEVDEKGMMTMMGFKEFIVILGYSHFYREKDVNYKLKLLYDLFDRNHDSWLSKGELSDMIATSIGNRLDLVLGVGKVTEVFRQFLRDEKKLFILDVYEELNDLKARHEEKGIPVEDMQFIFRTYFEVREPKDVQLTERVRENLRIDISAHVDDHEPLPIKLIEPCLQEVKDKLEKKYLSRFRNQIVKKSLFADVVWDEMNISHNEKIGFETFVTWCERSEFSEGLFKFLEQASDEVTNVAGVANFA